MKQAAFLFLFVLTSCVSLRAQEKLKNVTLGFAAGFSQNFRSTFDYSLSPNNNSLKVQRLSPGAFVISTVFFAKFKKLAEDTAQAKQIRIQGTANEVAKFWHRLGFVLGLNVVEVSNSVRFNKAIDGGAGLGYFVGENFQVALMFDVTSVRQMREHIVNEYQNRPIPLGNDFYNALDPSDTRLFYSKVVSGMSLKFVFSL